MPIAPRSEFVGFSPAQNDRDQSDFLKKRDYFRHCPTTFPTFFPNMPAAPVFTGARADFLQSQLEGYTEAIANGTSLEFLSTVYARFFKLFDESKPNSVEPSKEEIERVMKEDTEWEGMVSPVRRAGQDEKSYSEELKLFDEHQGTVLSRIAVLLLWPSTLTPLARVTFNFRQQIRRWMGYRCIKKNAHLEAHVILLNRLAGMVHGKPGKNSTGYNVWYAETGKVLDKEINERYEQLKAEAVEEQKGENAEEGAKKTKAVTYVTVRQEIVKAEFEKLPAEEQKMWQEKATEEHKEKIDVWETSKNAEYSRLPQDHQQAIDLLPSWFTPILEGVQAITGLNCSLWAASPMPADEGRVNVMGIHCGRTIATDSSPATGFGTRYRSGIKKFIVPMYGDFCRHTYTPEDLTASSLGSEAKLGNVLKENPDGHMSFDRWDKEERADFLKRKGKDKTPNTAPVPASDSSLNVNSANLSGPLTSKQLSSGSAASVGACSRTLPCARPSTSSTLTTLPMPGSTGTSISQSIHAANSNTGSTVERLTVNIKKYSYSEVVAKKPSKPSKPSTSTSASSSTRADALSSSSTLLNAISAATSKSTAAKPITSASSKSTAAKSITSTSSTSTSA
ncbi:SERTA domain-containing protein 3 [Marasmius crinis-equi]|uniref:SERTA domain-containing protein 3 n=1 Tax=Marasmius crinis-equi TaxID=585013 RepID=A0ABR3EYW6_9AGAR